MKTRSGSYYGLPPTVDLSDRISDNLLISILSNLSSDQNPHHFIMALMACKRFHRVAMDPSVLLNASEMVCYMSTKSDCLLQKMADTGNVEACYMIGMIRFYCLSQWGVGVSLLEKAAEESHVRALYSLGIIRFHGRGCVDTKDVEAGVALLERAAILGHIGAKVELAHYVGKEFLVELTTQQVRDYICESYQLRVTLSDDHLPEKDLTMRCLLKWFNRPRLQQLHHCAYRPCGLVETKSNEFRQCPVRRENYYCSWNCQALAFKATEAQHGRGMVFMLTISNG